MSPNTLQDRQTDRQTDRSESRQWTTSQRTRAVRWQWCVLRF